MSHWLGTAITTYLLHPLHANGYQWWSGAGSDLGEATLIGTVIGLAKHRNCHHKGCWWPGHRHPTYGWPACRHHWHEPPAHTRGGPTLNATHT